LQAYGCFKKAEVPEKIRDYCRATQQNIPESVAEITRSCLEGLALRYRWVKEALEDLTGKEIKTIRVVGGGSQNKLLNQFTADACNCTVVTGPIEATALGNVMMQAIATGQLKSLEEGRKAVAASIKQESYQANPSKKWDDAFEKFKLLID